MPIKFELDAEESEVIGPLIFSSMREGEGRSLLMSAPVIKVSISGKEFEAAITRVEVNSWVENKYPEFSRIDNLPAKVIANLTVEAEILPSSLKKLTEKSDEKAE